MNSTVVGMIGDANASRDLARIDVCRTWGWWRSGPDRCGVRLCTWSAKGKRLNIGALHYRGCAAEARCKVRVGGGEESESGKPGVRCLKET